MLTDELPRVPIAHLPTPLEHLPRLSAKLKGPELWIKRDDQTGLATGGNKARKLEFLVAEALDREADLLITGGAAQSNHARQTAAAAAKLGLDCTLVLSGEQPEEIQGNLLLDLILGAEIIWGGEEPLAAVMSHVAAAARDRGRRPYVIPYGGSNATGAVGYVAGMEELLTQCDERELKFDWILSASSSGGTQSGLVVGARALGYAGHILGVSVSPPAETLRERLSGLATATAEHLGLTATFRPDDFEVNDEYVGAGYGMVSDREREAIYLLARTEGILLDPVYTGKAFGGLLDLIRRGFFGPEERVLFWHTGGTGGLFGHRDEVL